MPLTGGTLTGPLAINTNLQPQLTITGIVNDWSYIRLNNSNYFWDIATNSFRGNMLEFRAGGSDLGMTISPNGETRISSHLWVGVKNGVIDVHNPDGSADIRLTIFDDLTTGLYSSKLNQIILHASADGSILSTSCHSWSSGNKSLVPLITNDGGTYNIWVAGLNRDNATLTVGASQDNLLFGPIISTVNNRLGRNLDIYIREGYPIFHWWGNGLVDTYYTIPGTAGQNAGGTWPINVTGFSSSLLNGNLALYVNYLADDALFLRGFISAHSLNPDRSMDMYVWNNIPHYHWYGTGTDITYPLPATDGRNAFGEWNIHASQDLALSGGTITGSLTINQQVVAKKFIQTGQFWMNWTGEVTASGWIDFVEEFPAKPKIMLTARSQAPHHMVQATSGSNDFLATSTHFAIYGYRTSATDSWVEWLACYVNYSKSSSSN